MSLSAFSIVCSPAIQLVSSFVPVGSTVASSLLAGFERVSFRIWGVSEIRGSLRGTIESFCLGSMLEVTCFRKTPTYIPSDGAMVHAGFCNMQNCPPTFTSIRGLARLLSVEQTGNG